MIFIRLFVIAFNIAVVTYLVYRLFQVSKQPIKPSQKAIIIVAGVLLLIAPFAMFLKIMPASPQYFLIYPAAVSLFIYLIRQT
jgi:hypothetical protein